MKNITFEQVCIGDRIILPIQSLAHKIYRVYAIDSGARGLNVCHDDGSGELGTWYMYQDDDIIHLVEPKEWDE